MYPRVSGCCLLWGGEIDHRLIIIVLDGSLTPQGQDALMVGGGGVNGVTSLRPGGTAPIVHGTVKLGGARMAGFGQAVLPSDVEALLQEARDVEHSTERHVRHGGTSASHSGMSLQSFLSLVHTATPALS